MCTIKDYENMHLGSYRNVLETELESWHEWHLPVTGTVLDIGAGAGETAQFFLLHGAEKVICIEADRDALRMLHENFDKDPRVTIIESRVDRVKSDIEGSEKNAVIETHFPFKIRRYTVLGTRHRSTLIIREDWGNIFTRGIRKIIEKFL
jgi:SAM-dependent methyltransferase